MKLKKAVIVVIIISLLCNIGLGIAFYYVTKTLTTANETIEKLTFSEGKVDYNESGGTVIASLEDWVYFEDDSFVSQENPGGKLVSLIFTDLYGAGKINGFDTSEANKSLVKISFSKVIFVKSGIATESSDSKNNSETTGRPYFYVDCGNISYYISPTEGVPQAQVEETTE